MKYLNHLLLPILVIGLAMASCKEDAPLSSYESHQRAIEDFQMEGQIGEPVITHTPDSAHLTVYIGPNTDLSSVSPEIKVSYKASIEPASGEEVNFAENGGQYTYTVTSQNGETREWTVYAEEFESDLLGSWSVESLMFEYYIGEGESWGWGDTKPIYYNLGGDSANVQAVQDDTLTFSIEGVREDGSTYGTFTHDPGPDGEYADFGPYTYKFDELPKEEATWERNFSNNTIIFNKGTDEETRTSSLRFMDGASSMEMPFDPGPKDIVWNQHYPSMELQATLEFWYSLSKVE